jgi:hypothetical protein
MELTFTGLVTSSRLKNGRLLLIEECEIPSMYAGYEPEGSYYNIYLVSPKKIIPINTGDKTAMREIYDNLEGRQDRKEFWKILRERGHTGPKSQARWAEELEDRNRTIAERYR